MPLRDGTGPDGKGPRTGRSMGNCGTNETDEVRSNNRQGLGRGGGRGSGQGRGQGRGQGGGQGGRGQGRGR
ncbi:MAG: DUF5320 domain-containing protein [Elusimicrobiota bacterium]|nr:DUF5320 domain-containing protein [Elusimicrobiota bacterium]